MRIGFLIGLAIVILLVGWQGVTTIADRLAGAGWGILLVALFIPPDLLFRSASFHLLFARDRRPRFTAATLAMWIGSSVNFLLPVATVGGEFVKARVLTLRSVPGVDAAASVVLDKTVQAISILVWALVGIAILAVVAPADDPMVISALVGRHVAGVRHRRIRVGSVRWSIWSVRPARRARVAKRQMAVPGRQRGGSRRGDSRGSTGGPARSWRRPGCASPSVR